MELRQLRYFLSVLECGSLGRAALETGVGVSALSQQLTKLESELSTRLLTRSSVGVTPTAAGLAFEYHARLTLRQADYAMLAARSGRMSGYASVGMAPTTASVLGLALIARMRELLQERYLALRMESYVVQEDFARGGCRISCVMHDQDDTRLIVYNSGTAGVREGDELAGCVGNIPGDTRTALFSIDVIEVPVANPAAARIVDRPRVFAAGGQIAGLWRGGDHGEGTQDTSETDQCHDITVFPAKKLAAGACSGNGIILDIADPLKPKRIDDVTDKGFAYWHSATFSNDGSKVLFTDEWGGGGRPRCQAGDPTNWGANAFYAIENGKLVYRGTYKLPAPQSDKENCVAHNGSIIPVPGRDLFVQAWYQGGISVIDFTDPANVKEIAYFDRGPVDKDQLAMGGYWSAYWYKGKIYATEIARGLDVFELTPSEFLTAEEIAAAAAAVYPGDVFNPQTQTQVTWPAEVAAAAEASRQGG